MAAIPDLTVVGARPERSFEERYLAERGTLYLTGIQALVRLPIDQHRRDVRAGLRTGAFISGYPGSPLAGFDIALQAAQPILAANAIIHQPGQNEELAATALMGSQMLDGHPHERYDGVVGIWYGKGPGVDRSGDALRHGNFAGTSTHGAVVVLSGEDHEAKSSTMPFHQEYAFESAGIPVLYPATIAEFLEFGLHAVALSRYSGCWVALKLVNSLCDGGATVDVAPDRPQIVVPALEIDGKPFAKSTDFTFFPGLGIETERRLFRERHLAVRAYARANRLDRIEVRSANDRVGIVTAGKSYADLRQALRDLGFDDGALRELGVRVLRLGLIYPTDDALIREFARGLDEVVVIEEKRGFVEQRVKAALCEAERRVRVVGKEDEAGRELFPTHGGMDADLIAAKLGPRLRALTSARTAVAREGVLDDRLAELAAVNARDYQRLPKRTPNYCSGCPHNTSTVLLPGRIAWGSPGCHSFASIIEQPERHIEAMTQLGGEGMPWIGLAPFTERTHIVQNVGDGSLFHSSYMNIRFAIAAGVNITFKILFNGAVANTGAQKAVGGRSVAELVQLLGIEGVRRIIVSTKDRGRYDDVTLPVTAEVQDVARFAEAQATLEKIPGVTVLIYDETCANERRREQKRGTLPRPTTFVVVNEDVCEACGDCRTLTNCMSLHDVPTEFGPKTQVHQSSCNQDMSCIGGDCPSFVTVETAPGGGVARPAPRPIDVDVPEPVRQTRLVRPYHISIPGVGGTGVLTLNAILAQAAALDGLRVLSYDQTGAAQKWGPVLSSLILAESDEELSSNKVGAGQADLYLALDLLAAADPANLDRCEPQRTRALINTSLLPSGEMVRDARFSVTPLLLTAAIERYTSPEGRVLVDARAIAEAAFGDFMMTNVVALGAAYQAGLIPISVGSIEAAIRINGVAVENNTLALRYGRLAQHDRAALDAALAPPAPLADRSADAVARLSGTERAAYDGLIARCARLPREAASAAAIRIADLIAYQSPDHAQRYVDMLVRVASREREALAGSSGAIALAVARNLHKLMAYKDEYEVARLQTRRGFLTRTHERFRGTQSVAYNFHPPVLRALGMKRKVRLGPWSVPFLRALASMKSLRGTALDPFGRAEVRRVERALIPWYVDLLDRALERLTPANAFQVEAIAGLPDSIRGYEDIKLRSADLARARAAELLAALDANAGPLAD